MIPLKKKKEKNVSKSIEREHLLKKERLKISKTESGQESESNKVFRAKVKTKFQYTTADDYYCLRYDELCTF
ncbi:MAG: hypothetical protein U0T36_05615 [Saprospiraceae bacterium]